MTKTPTRNNKYIDFMNCMTLLNSEERLNLRKQHKKERDRRKADRIKAVLLHDAGWTYVQIAEALLLEAETIGCHVNEYIEQGKLKPQNGGSESKLDTVKTDVLCKHLEAQTYTTVKDICQYVKAKWGISYTVNGMTAWLHGQGFSYKKPKQTPAKTDPKAQEEFIEYYEQLKAKTPKNEPIVFLDSVHPTMSTKVSGGWIRRGKDKLIATTASRTRINITGAIDLESMKVVSESYKTIDGESTIAFLKNLLQSNTSAPKIHVILDQSGYHRSLKVGEFSEKNGVELHFLPAYSPNLNPIERLWKVMNERVRNNRFFSTAKEFRDTISGFFKITLPEIAPTLKGRINDNFSILKPVSSF